MSVQRSNIPASSRGPDAATKKCRSMHRGYAMERRGSRGEESYHLPESTGSSHLRYSMRWMPGVRYIGPQREIPAERFILIPAMASRRKISGWIFAMHII